MTNAMTGLAAGCLCVATLTVASLAQAQSAVYLDQVGPGTVVPYLPAVGVIPTPDGPALARLNTATSVQVGNNNQSTLTAPSRAGPSGYGVQQTQIGDGNSAQAVQQGALNTLSQTQIGNHNPLSATQIGVGNNLTERQYGNNTSGVSVTQYGGAHAVVTQSR